MPQYHDISKLLNKTQPRQGYGELCIKEVELSLIDFGKSFILKKFVNSIITENDQIQKLYFRVSFYDQALDRITGPVCFSE
jgi:hypothetical protein